MRIKKDHDMSMEEVLRSIRKHVTEDRKPMIYSSGHDDESMGEVIRLEDPYEEDFFNEDTRYKKEERTENNKHEHSCDIPEYFDDFKHLNGYTNMHKNNNDRNSDNESLLENDQKREIFGSFNKLRHHINDEKQSNSSLETFFKSIATPMIAEWLNENLEKIVKELVEKEIEKITGKNN